MPEHPNMIPIDHNKPRFNPLGLKNPPKTPAEVVQEYRDSQPKTPEKMFPEEKYEQNVPDKNGLGYSKNEISDRAMPSYLHKQLMNLGGYSTNTEVRDKAQKTIREQQEKDSLDMGGSRWSIEDIKKVQVARGKDLKKLDDRNDLIPGNTSTPTQVQSTFFNSVKSQEARTNQKSHDSHRAGNPAGWEPSTPERVVPTTSFEGWGGFGKTPISKVPAPKVPTPPKVDKDFREQIFKFPGAGKNYTPNSTITPLPPAPSPAPTPTEQPELVKPIVGTPPPKLPDMPRLIRDPVTGMWKDAPKEIEPKNKKTDWSKLHPPNWKGGVPDENTKWAPPPEHREQPENPKKTGDTHPLRQDKPEPQEAPSPSPSPSPTGLAKFISKQQRIPNPTPTKPIPDWIPKWPFKWPWAPKEPKPVDPTPVDPTPVDPEKEDNTPDGIRKRKTKKREEEEKKRQEEAGGGVPGAGGQINTPPKPFPEQPVPADPVPEPKPPEKKDPPKEPKKPNPMDFAMMLPTQGSVNSFPSMVTGIPTHSAPSFEKTQLEINYYSELGF